MSSTGIKYEQQEGVLEQAGTHQTLSESEDRNDAIVAHNDQYSSSDEEREGRFHGPDSSWRFYTQEDRDVAASLDQAENNNLSIHLYNTHKWKQSRRLKALDPHAKNWLSKQSWIQRDEQGRLPFLPDSDWTAWPLKPLDVPRSNEVWGVPVRDPLAEADTYRKEVPWKPSLDLQELVKAEILRQAKRRFEQREWTTADSPSTSLDSESAENLSESSRRSDPEEDGDSLQSADGLPPSERPSFLADEDVAEALTQPSTRHILSNLRVLLDGLHNSRAGHRAMQSRSRSRPRPRGSGSRSRGRGPADGSEKTEVANHHAFKYRDEELHDMDLDQDTKSEHSKSRSRSTKRTSYRHRLGTRDWSEVLGVASLVGWDRTVVDRAGRRCAALFGEGMYMRALPGITSAYSGDGLFRYPPDALPRAEHEPDQPATSKSEESGDVNPLALVGAQFPCPHRSCPRHENAYEKRWRLREHLKRKHHHSNEDADRMLQGV